MAIKSKNIFLFFSRPSASFSYIITIYIDQISKNRFLGRFGTVRPKSRKTGFFGQNRALSVFLEYCPPTSGQKAGKSLEPFSRTFATNRFFQTLDNFSVHFLNDPNFFWMIQIFSAKTGSVILLRNLRAYFRTKNQKNPSSRFPELLIT